MDVCIIYKYNNVSEYQSVIDTHQRKLHDKLMLAVNLV